MEITLNGERTETAAANVADLLRERGADPARVAVVRNDRMVPAAARELTLLSNGDRIEVLVFAGGG